MAEVWLAEAHSGQRVALKRIRRDRLGEPGFVPLFLREAEIALQVDHGNIAKVFGFGEHEGEYFLVMEYVDGVTLSEIVAAAQRQGRRLDPLFSAYVVAVLARALHHLHTLPDPETGQAQGLVHRDVSPQNLMVGFDGQVKLVDFGIAKGRTSQNLTERNMVRGKFQYFSPEQVRREPLDGRSDVFACGVLLFELCTGRLPFEGALLEVVDRIAREDLPVPSQVNPEIDPALEEILSKAMAPKERRYRTAAALEEELLAWVRGRAPGYGEREVAATLRSLRKAPAAEGASAGGATQAGGERRTARLHKLLRPEVLLAAAGLLFAVFLAWWIVGEPSVPPDRSRAPPEGARAPPSPLGSKPVAGRSPTAAASSDERAVSSTPSETVPHLPESAPVSGNAGGVPATGAVAGSREAAVGAWVPAVRRRHVRLEDVTVPDRLLPAVAITLNDPGAWHLRVSKGIRTGRQVGELFRTVHLQAAFDGSGSLQGLELRPPPNDPVVVEVPQAPATFRTVLLDMNPCTDNRGSAWVEGCAEGAACLRPTARWRRLARVQGAENCAEAAALPVPTFATGAFREVRVRGIDWIWMTTAGPHKRQLLTQGRWAGPLVGDRVYLVRPAWSVRAETPRAFVLEFRRRSHGRTGLR